MNKRIFSGVRPTGNIHLGNYLGAIKHWKKDQEADKLFCIVDQHALTTREEGENLRDHIRLIAAAYLACGVDPNNDCIFIQSDVPFHTELAWYLGCITPMGWLNRMTQFKDKAKKKEQANLGLYAYPVLMAADILAYKATHVPVGEDQKQHVELARDIAEAFNRMVGEEIFPLPEPVIEKNTARIMNLRDGTKKMSKSDLSDYSRINLLDDSDTIFLKIRKARTDSDPIPEKESGLENRPEAKNLLSLYAIFQETSLAAVCENFKGRNFSDFKRILSDCLIEALSPIRLSMTKLLKEKSYLDSVLQKGAEKAALKTCLKEIRKKLGVGIT